MSRYKFEELFTNENINDLRDIKDTFGNSIQEWIKRGAFGYDRPLSTYFLQLDSEQGDLPDIWYGAHYGEIKSPYLLVSLINRIFNKNFNYNAKVIEILIKERNDRYKDEPCSVSTIRELKSWDELCKTNQNINIGYVQSGLFAKNI
jgi:hypothetical protein